MRSEVHARAFDGAIAALAARQYGVVARAQLLAIGLLPGAIHRRIEAKRLHRIHAGVYAVGHARVCREGRWLAAVLACGDGAVLSHRSAAALWGIRQHEGRIEVTARHAHRRGLPVAVSRSQLFPDEVTGHRGIPVTTPERTLLDLGTRLPPHQLDRAGREADHLRLVDFGALERLLERHERGRGTRHLRKAIATAVQADGRTRSDMEDRFRALVLDAKLPAPRFNETLELNATTTIEADAVWLDEKVIVELDGYDAHRTRHRFRTDRARDRHAHVAGWLVLRYAWLDLDAGAARELRTLLSERRLRRSGRPRSAALSA